VVIFLVCLYGYALHSRTRYDAFDDMLQRDVLHIASELVAARTPADSANTLEASALLGAVARVYDTRGAVLREAEHSSAPPALDLPQIFIAGTRAAYPHIAAIAPSARAATPSGGIFTVLSDANGERWRVYSIRTSLEGRYLTATLSLLSIDRSVARFGRLMLLCAILASVATFFVGWLLARHALRPVAALTAGAIAQSRMLSRRVAPHAGRDELDRLATTFHEILASQEDANEAQQRFTSAASHELRAPLTVVLANLELLQRGSLRMPPEERALAIDEAHGEATRMARLVADLLSLARADAGAPLRREPVELDRVVIDVVGESRHQLRGQQLAVGAFEPVIVQGDPDRLKQLVLILVDNAITYTHGGGRVDVSLQRIKGGALIKVRDTGVGIAAEDLSHVFERFYRADPARSRNAGGTGLGLSIARWIVEEHGGTVELSSVLGRGTTATVRLVDGA